MSEITASILVKGNKTDPVYQSILVRDGEYYHPQLCRWVEIPEQWREKALNSTATHYFDGTPAGVPSSDPYDVGHDAACQWIADGRPEQKPSNPLTGGDGVAWQSGFAMRLRIEESIAADW